MDFSTCPAIGKRFEREEDVVLLPTNVDSTNHVIEHVSSRATEGNGFRNVVAGCRACNNKERFSVEDFLRSLIEMASALTSLRIGVGSNVFAQENSGRSSAPRKGISSSQVCVSVVWCLGPPSWSPCWPVNGELIDAADEAVDVDMGTKGLGSLVAGPSSTRNPSTRGCPQDEDVLGTSSGPRLSPTSFGRALVDDVASSTALLSTKSAAQLDALPATATSRLHIFS